jgi:hypothetical protein
MQLAPLTRLALRDLWVSLRFVPLLAASLASGLVVSLLPPTSGGDPVALAWGMMTASLLVAAIAAATLSTLRRRGTAGWLAVRAMPRGTLLVAWGLAAALPVVVGSASAAFLGWLSIANGPQAAIDPVVYGVVAAAAAVAPLEAVAIGLICGSFGRPVVSAAVAIILAAGLLIPGALLYAEPPYLPAAGLGLLASLTSLVHPFSDAVLSLGLGLATIAALIALAAAAFERTTL